MEQLRRNAIWATFLMVAPPGSPASAQAEARLSSVWSQLPDWMQQVTGPHAVACSRDGAEPAMCSRWPAAFASGSAPDLYPPGILVFNDTALADETTRHTHWRRWLHLYNTLQTLGGVLLVTTEGLQHRDYETITLAVTTAAGRQPADATSQAWARVLDKVLLEVKAGMQRLMEMGVPPPDEVGYEHANDSGDVDAEAEAAWCVAQVVVLTEAQAEYASVWQDQGWTTVLAQGEWEVTLQDTLKASGVRS